MKDLLRLEFRKLRTQKSFYICLAIMVAMILISGFTYKMLADHAEAIAEITEGEQSLPLSGGAFMLSFLSASNFSLISAIFVSIVVCGDYESQIVKNVYARGYSRNSYYFSKLLYVFAVTTVMFIATFAVSALLGLVLFGFDGVEGKIFLLIAMQYIVTMAVIALYFSIAFMIKKLGGTIAVCIFAPMLVSLLFELADTALKLNDFKVASVWLSSFTTDLSVLTVGMGRIIACVLLSVAYAVAFIFAGCAVNRNSEV